MSDWRKAEDYAYTKSLTLHQWAWEFLRRDPGYREAYQRFLDNPSSIDAYVGACLPFDLAEPVDVEATALEVGVPFSRYVGRNLLGHPPKEITGPEPGKPSTEIPLTFDVTMPLDPQLTEASEILRNFQKWWKTWAAEEDGVRPEEVKIRPRRQFKSEHLQTYIRLLDGVASGASLGELGRGLFSDKGDRRRSAQLALQRAREIASGGYRDLLLKHPEGAA